MKWGFRGSDTGMSISTYCRIGQAMLIRLEASGITAEPGVEPLH